MDAYSALEEELRTHPKHWCLTGAAGFIGSHLLERLLTLGQTVSGVDNFSTGLKKNVADVRQRVGEESWKRFTLFEGDVADPAFLAGAVRGAEVILHQAALGSVPRSVQAPLDSDWSNVHGTLNVFDQARRAGIVRVVYASSSSVYGTNEDAIKREDRTGDPLSPYAAGKHATELYAAACAHSYGLECIGLRYFNVFGGRQSPEGPYAAVIPRWLAALTSGQACVMFGDGSTSRDFCYVENVVRANLLAGTKHGVPRHIALNIAVGESTSLRDLYEALSQQVWHHLKRSGVPPEIQCEPFRLGDIRHSCADVSLARETIGYLPAVRASDGFVRTVAAFLSNESAPAA